MENVRPNTPELPSVESNGVAPYRGADKSAGVFQSAEACHDARRAAAAVNQPDALGWIDPQKIDVFLTDTIKIVLALDGSDASMRGLEWAVKGVMMADREVQAIITHIYDDSKDYLPPSCRKDAIRSRCEAVVTSYVRESRYRFRFIPREPRRTVGKQLCGVIADNSADFITMGIWGRKGPNSKDTFVSNVQEVLRSGRCSVIVMTMDEESQLPQNRPAKFVVSASLNAAATKAFVDVIRLSKPTDEIHVVYVKAWMEHTDSDYTTSLREKYNALFQGIAGTAEDGCTELARFSDRIAQFQVIEKSRSESTAQAVVRYADGIEADFIAVGTNNTRAERGKEPLGSVSLGICMETTTNFIVSSYTPEFRHASGTGSVKRR